MVYDILPEENLHFSDIRDCLNSGGGSVTNDVASAFKTTANINMWAKYKPVHINDTPFTDASSDWWKGSAGNCGIIPKLTNTLQALIQNIDGDNNGWVYDPPKGGEHSPYRLTDFAGYYKNAQCQINGASVSAFILTDGTLEAQCSYQMDDDNAKWVSFKDINYQQLNNCYFGVALLKDSSIIRRATAINTISQGGFSASFSTIGLNDGDYEAFFFLSNIPYLYTDPDKVSNYFTVPNTSIVKLKIGPAIQFGATAEYIYTNKVKTGINYAIMFTMNVGEHLTLTNNYVTIRFAGNSVDAPLQEGEKRIKLSNGTVYKDGTIELESEDGSPTGFITPWNGRFIIPTNLKDNDFRIDYSFQSGKYKTSVLPAEEIDPDA